MTTYLEVSKLDEHFQSVLFETSEWNFSSTDQLQIGFWWALTNTKNFKAGSKKETLPDQHLATHASDLKRIEWRFRQSRWLQREYGRLCIKCI